ncbi:MAG: alginate export family protein [Chromatiales bacterium]|nr:alginate export family protein [Chromatiales bacterium]
MSTDARPLAAATLAAAAWLLAPAVHGADLTEDMAAAVAGSTVNLGFRYRFEAVDDDAFAKEAWASTLRSRLTVATKPVSGFGVLLEVDDVRHVGADNFNDTRNGVTDRPGVTDPEGTDLNQALLRYTGWQDTEVILGRQRIERANQRFVGGVGWRQNEQTFDAAGISHRFGKRLTTSYSWVGQVNRIQGPDNGTPPPDLDSNTHLLDASWSVGPLMTLSAYGYLMDFDNADSLSNETFGLRATGASEVSPGWKLGYALEYARQSDYGDNPVDYDAGYSLIELGLSAAKMGFRLGWEVLEGDSSAGSAFRTPLATLHAFQGWADKFLTTPDAGVQDLYLAVTGKALGADLLLRAHDFSAQTGGGDWGTELDFSANWPLGKHYAVLLKGATYDADDLSTDTSKFWVQLTATF